MHMPQILYLVMVTDAGELEVSAKDGEVCNGIRTRHNLALAHPTLGETSGLWPASLGPHG